MEELANAPNKGSIIYYKSVYFSKLLFTKLQFVVNNKEYIIYLHLIL